MDGPQPAPALTLTKDDGVATATTGDSLAYDLDFVNTSAGTSTPGQAENVILVDTLPEGVTFDGCSFGPGYSGICSESAGLVTIVLDQAVPAGGSGTVTINATVTSPTGTQITNSARLSWEDELGNRYPPVTAVDVDALTGSDLAVTKIVDNSIPDVGEDVTFTVTVAHQAGEPATGVVVTDDLPVGLSYQSHIASVGTYDPASGQWTVGALGVGASASLQITVTVIGTSGVYNVAEITAADQLDPDSTPGNSNTTEDDYALADLAVGGGGTVCWVVADDGRPHTTGGDLLTLVDEGVETVVDGGALPNDGTGTGAIEAIAFQPVSEILYATNNGRTRNDQHRHRRIHRHRTDRLQRRRRPGLRPHHTAALRIGSTQRRRGSPDRDRHHHRRRHRHRLRWE